MLDRGRVPAPEGSWPPPGLPVQPWAGVTRHEHDTVTKAPCTGSQRGDCITILSDSPSSEPPSLGSTVSRHHGQLLRGEIGGAAQKGKPSSITTAPCCVNVDGLQQDKSDVTTEFFESKECRGLWRAQNDAGFLERTSVHAECWLEVKRLAPAHSRGGAPRAPAPET